ncbi:MAG: Cell-division-associated, ABC-transporter-like signaling protein FtsE, partial [uncultured Solirubrobacteraceae bacterium]
GHRRTSCPRPQPRRRAAGSSPLGRGVRRRLEDLRVRRSRPRACHLHDRPRRVRLPRRADRLGQVDDHAAADQGARAHLGNDQRGRQGPRQDRGQGRRPLPSQPRRRLSGLQAPAEPDGLRQRRLRTAGHGAQAQGDPREGARHPAPHGPLAEAALLPRSALRRRAAARRGRARVRQPPAAPARRRADRQPRPRDLHRDHAAALPHQSHGDDRHRRHARQRDGRPDAPAGHRGPPGPHRARRARRRVLDRGREHLGVRLAHARRALAAAAPPQQPGRLLRRRVQGL